MRNHTPLFSLAALANEVTRRAALGLALCTLVFCGSCRTAQVLPPADLHAAGWRVRRGQAVWKPTRTRPELAGEILLATRANGDCLVQFDKTPFTLATAQVAGDHWQITFGAGDYTRQGQGRPPSRFVWFQLPRALAGEGLSHDWRFTGAVTNLWRLENQRTGESLEGCLDP